MKKNSLISKAAILSVGLSCLLAVNAAYSPANQAQASAARDAAEDKPNFVYILADDLGYGDIGCYGSELNRTPNIDGMAQDGISFTDFYACPLCTPSRMSTMTGSYALRAGLPSVIGGVNSNGISDTEITVADCLKEQGYTTGIVGKWHLGDQPDFLPTRHGFDSYFGLPYSNDMGENAGGTNRLPLLRDEKTIEWDPDQSLLTERYTKESIEFIKKNQNKPFFLYLAHMWVHKDLHPKEEFMQNSQNGMYGAVVEEVDWSVGEILKTLEELGLDDNTIVVFTSDNGGFLPIEGVSNAPFRGGKAHVTEGGIRVPFIVKWPAQIPAGVKTSEIAGVIDVLPTFAEIAGAEPINGNLKGNIIDGKNILPLMKCEEGAKSQHEAWFYYADKDLRAVRSGKWKLNFNENALYNLETDVTESVNLINKYPDIVRELIGYAESAIKDIGNTTTIGSGARPTGKYNNPQSFWNRQGGVPAPDIRTGDVNGDGIINLKDIIIMRRYILDGRDLSANEIYYADRNKDGQVNIIDIMLQRDWILNI